MLLSPRRNRVLTRRSPVFRNFAGTKDESLPAYMHPTRASGLFAHSLALRAGYACLMLLALWVAISANAAAQEKSVRPGINDSFKNPDVGKFVERFEREGREVYDKRDRIVQLLGLKAGTSVADIGAGTGIFTNKFSTAVGKSGRVYAVDIAKEFIDHIEKQCRKQGIENVVGVVCRQDSVTLPKKSIDVAFACDTYHHFEFPQKTLHSIHEALRPGGELIVIDFERIEGVSSEWILGHVRAGKETVEKEVESAGFQLVREEKLLKDNYFLRFRKTDRQSKLNVSPAKEENGVLVHTVRSEFQGGPTKVKVLLPKGYIASSDPKKTLYVLPVEAGDGTRWGDPVRELIKNDIATRFDLVCVVPTFSHLPWYADHPSDKGIRQESYFLKIVVPLVESNYRVLKERDARLLAGFSKSGWGAFSLLLRNPGMFGKAAAFDAPLMMKSPSRYGMQTVFATQENFEPYQISKLLEKWRSQLGKQPRLVLLGFGNFQSHLAQCHELMGRLGIPHHYQNETRMAHHWDSGWLPQAVEAFVRAESSRP